MTKVRRFEDLVCWQKARKLASSIHGLTNHLDFSKDFRLRDQGEYLLESPPDNYLPDDYQTNDD